MDAPHLRALVYISSYRHPFEFLISITKATVKQLYDEVLETKARASLGTNPYISLLLFVYVYV